MHTRQAALCGQPAGMRYRCRQPEKRKMEIDINQKKISIGAEYKIHSNGNEKYFATKKLFRFLGEINLFDNSQKRVRYQIKQNWAWFKLSYDLIKYDNNKFKLRTVSIWKRHFECRIGEDLYEIFGHRGRKYSIYKNDIQIAWWDKEAVSWFNGDNYKLIADEDSEVELLICFCLIMDNAKSQNDERTTVHYDFGNIGPQAKKFNQNWKPKN